MSCERYDRNLALHVEGDLARREALQLARHLGDCARCRAFLAALADSQRSVKDLAAEPVDEIALAAVRAGVLATVRERSAPAGPVPAWRLAFAALGWRWSLAVTIAVAVAALGLFWWARPQARQRRPTIAAYGAASELDARSGWLPSVKAGEGRGTDQAPADVSPRTHREPGSTQWALAQEGTRHSTARGVGTVSRDRAGETGQAIPALSPEEADQLARAIVALSRIRRLSDMETPTPAEPSVSGQVVLATADPNVVIYWQLDSNGG